MCSSDLGIGKGAVRVETGKRAVRRPHERIDFTVLNGGTVRVRISRRGELELVAVMFSPEFPESLHPQAPICKGQCLRDSCLSPTTIHQVRASPLKVFISLQQRMGGSGVDQITPSIPELLTLLSLLGNLIL